MYEKNLIIINSKEITLDYEPNVLSFESQTMFIQ